MLAHQLQERTPWRPYWEAPVARPCLQLRLAPHPPAGHHTSLRLPSPPEAGVQYWAPSGFLRPVLGWPGCPTPSPSSPGFPCSPGAGRWCDGGWEEIPPELRRAHPWLGLLPLLWLAFPLQDVSGNSSALLLSLRRCPFKEGSLVRRILVPPWVIYLFF